MTPMQQLFLGQGGKKSTYIDDVFHTQVFKSTNQNADYKVTNNIDNSGEGGFLWYKDRNGSGWHLLWDTERGSNKYIYTNSDSGGSTAELLKSFDSDGYTIKTGTTLLDTSRENVLWNFRKAPGFFDILEFTETGSDATISHQLGSVPGMIIMKTTSRTSPWFVYHRGAGESKWIKLNETGGATSFSSGGWGSVTSSSFNFTNQVLGYGSGTKWIVYLFAGGESPAAEANSVGLGYNTGARIICGDSSNTTADFNFGTGAFTIECWIKANSTQTTYPRVINVGPQWSTNHAGIYWDHDDKQNKVSFFVFNRQTSAFLESSTKAFGGDGQWHHIAVSRSGDIWRLFVDGILEDTETWTGSFNTADSYCTIGNIPDSSTTSHFSGSVSNLRVVKGTAVYTSSFRLPTEPLTNITNTKLLCCNAASATSATVTPITLTKSGNVGENLLDSPFDDPSSFVYGEGGDQGIIKTGSFKSDGSGNANIFLGFEPQWVMTKKTSGTSNWLIWDTMRGWTTTGIPDAFLQADDNAAEIATSDYGGPNSTGFDMNGTIGSDSDGIYIAIRRPDPLVQKPQLATDVFAMATGQGGSSAPNYPGGIVVDYQLTRDIDTANSWYTGARLIGPKYLQTNATDAEADSATWVYDYMNGYNSGSSGSDWQSWQWKRHAGFDCIAYQGDGVVGRQLPHSLSRTVEMFWVRPRTGAGAAYQNWRVYHKGLNGGTNPEQYYLGLDQTNAESSHTQFWNDTAPTSTHVTLGNSAEGNANNYTYLMMLFASVSGVSAVGYYDGSSSDVTVTTGFQPRFVIIKATNNTRGWTVLDTTRGWGSGVDNKIMLNDTGAQVNTWDYGTPTSNGFTVSHSQYDINFTGWKYVYYAHA